MSKRDQRGNITIHTDISGQPIFAANNSELKEGNINSSDFNGLDNEEQYGLNLEERKERGEKPISLHIKVNISTQGLEDIYQKIISGLKGNVQIRKAANSQEEKIETNIRRDMHEDGIL
ncbi:hypothetical protein AgCh_033122 [Apium graveolens]